MLCHMFAWREQTNSNFCACSALRVNGSWVNWVSRPVPERQQAYLHRDKVLSPQIRYLAGNCRPVGEISRAWIDAAWSFQKKSLFQNVVISSPPPAFLKPDELQRLTGLNMSSWGINVAFSTEIGGGGTKHCTLWHCWYSHYTYPYAVTHPTGIN